MANKKNSKKTKPRNKPVVTSKNTPVVNKNPTKETNFRVIPTGGTKHKIKERKTDHLKKHLDKKTDQLTAMKRALQKKFMVKR